MTLADEGHAPVHGFGLGAVVFTKGLLSAEMNGAVGVVIGAAGARVAVCFQRGIEKSIKPQNLKILEED